MKVDIQNKKKRPVFVVQYDPRMPSITNIVMKHWRSMVTVDPNMKETFPEPPLVAYKVAPNLRAKLVRAKVPPKPTRKRRMMPGMKKCGKQNCPTCPYVQPGRTFKATATSYKCMQRGTATATTSATPSPVPRPDVANSILVRQEDHSEKDLDNT